MAAGDSQHRLLSDHFGPFLIFFYLRWFVFLCLLFLVNFFFVSQKWIKGLRLLIAFKAVFTGRIHTQGSRLLVGMGLLWSFSIGRPADKNDRLEAYPTLLSVASSDVPGAFCPDRHRRGSIKVSFSCFYPVAKAAEDDGFNRLQCHKINDLEHITGQRPLLSLRSSIIQTVISFTQVLLKEGHLLFDAIDKAIQIGGVGGRLREADLIPIPNPVPLDFTTPDEELRKWNRPLPHTQASNFDDNVNSYRERLLQEAGKTEDNLSPNDRSLIERLCNNFEANIAQFRAGNQLETMQLVQENNFNTPPKV